MRNERNTIFKESGSITTSDYFKLLCELLDVVRKDEATTVLTEVA